MIIKKCKSYDEKCPCMYCEDFCCVECGEETDTEKLCVIAREYCETLHQNQNVDRCVCCGEIIPEGRQVCIDCERKVEGNEG